MLARGTAPPLDEVAAEMQARDARDAGRDVAPLMPAADALILDTTKLNPAQALAAALELVRSCTTGG